MNPPQNSDRPKPAVVYDSVQHEPQWNYIALVDVPLHPELRVNVQ